MSEIFCLNYMNIITYSLFSFFCFYFGLLAYILLKVFFNYSFSFSSSSSSFKIFLYGFIFTAPGIIPKVINEKIPKARLTKVRYSETNFWVSNISQIVIVQNHETIIKKITKRIHKTRKTGSKLFFLIFFVCPIVDKQLLQISRLK